MSVGRAWSVAGLRGARGVVDGDQIAYEMVWQAETTNVADAVGALEPATLTAQTGRAAAALSFLQSALEAGAPGLAARAPSQAGLSRSPDAPPAAVLWAMLRVLAQENADVGCAAADVDDASVGTGTAQFGVLAKPPRAPFDGHGSMVRAAVGLAPRLQASRAGGPSVWLDGGAPTLDGVAAISGASRHAICL
jgi:hypothetical protein